MKKNLKSRKSGYYWVGWSYSQDMENVVQRIAYYNERFQSWTLNGEIERYTEDRFIDVAKHAIDQRRPWWFRLATGVMTGLILLALVLFLAALVSIIFNAIRCK